MNEDDRAADERAAKLLGVLEIKWFEDGQAWARYANDQWFPCPRCGSNAEDARHLVLALPREKRPAFIALLARELNVPEYLGSVEDAYPFVTATPRQLRDAVLAAMEAE